MLFYLQNLIHLNCQLLVDFLNHFRVIQMSTSCYFCCLTYSYSNTVAYVVNGFTESFLEKRKNFREPFWLPDNNYLCCFLYRKHLSHEISHIQPRTMLLPHSFMQSWFSHAKPHPQRRSRYGISEAGIPYCLQTLFSPCNFLSPQM